MPPIPAPADANATPQVAPWSWTVAELGAHLTEAQRQTILARLRAQGFNVKEWA